MSHQNQNLQQPRGSQAWVLSCSSSSQGQHKHKYHFQKTFTVSQAGNCRIMAYCDALSCLVISQPSPQASFLPGKESRTSAFMFFIRLHVFISLLFWKIQDSRLTKSPFPISSLLMQVPQGAAKMSLLSIDFIL